MRNLMNKLTIRDLAQTARFAGIASLVALAGVGGYWFATKLSLAEAQVLIAVLLALLTVMVVVGVWVIPQLVRTGTGLFREGPEHALAAGAAIAAEQGPGQRAARRLSMSRRFARRPWLCRHHRNPPSPSWVSSKRALTKKQTTPPVRFLSGFGGWTTKPSPPTIRSYPTKEIQ